MATIFKVLSTGLNALVFLAKAWKRFLDLLFIKAEVWGLLIFSLLGLFIVLLSKTKTMYIFLLSVFLLSYFYLTYKFICSIYKAYNNISSLKNFEINNKKDDQRKRAKTVGILLVLIYSLILNFSVILPEWQTRNVTNALIYILLIIFILYLILRFNNIFATILLIYSSTLVGIISLLYVFLVIVVALNYIINVGSVPILPPLGEDSLILLVIYIPQYYPFIWINVVVSLLIQITIILIRPAYTLSQTKSSFMFLSVAFSVTTITLFLFTGEIRDYFINFIQAYEFKPEDLSELTKVLGDLNSAITDSFIQRMITVIFLPYTIGSYICLYIVELIENKQKRKACEYYYAALYYNSKEFEEETYINLRKCLYFGGDIYEMIIINTIELKPYLEKMGYFRKITNSVNKEKRLKNSLICDEK